MALAIVDNRISDECERGLLIRGYNVIKVPGSKHLPEAMASHPDMLMFADGENIITSAEYCYEASYVFSDIRYYCARTKITFADEVQKKVYPHDAIFNALLIGKKLFCKADTVSRAVLEYAKDTGLEVVPIKQGYPACTTLPLSERAAITADEGMARALTAHGIRVTLIENGGISLPPYEYGFIGGAAGVHGGRVYFLGDFTQHPSVQMIADACLAEGLLPTSLSSGVLTDLGRIIFID